MFAFFLHCCCYNQVNFVGEGAINRSGPRREFFRILAQEFASTYLIGPDDNKYMQSNVTVLQVCMFMGMSDVLIIFVSFRMETIIRWGYTLLCLLVKEDVVYPIWQGLSLITLNMGDIQVFPSVYPQLTYQSWNCGSLLKR